MSSCCCPRTALSAVTFDSGAVLLRCHAHEQQRWVVAGREVSSTDALALLRDAFLAGRSRRPEPRSRRHHKVVQLPDTPAVAADPYPATPRLSGADASADLTALLNARGLSGSWAVA